MNDFDFGFKFELGDSVRFRAPSSMYRLSERPASAYSAIGGEHEHCLRIVARTLEECPGGVQRHYHARGLSGVNGGVAGTKSTLVVNEFEVEAYVPPTPAEGGDQ